MTYLYLLNIFYEDIFSYIYQLHCDLFSVAARQSKILAHFPLKYFNSFAPFAQIKKPESESQASAQRKMENSLSSAD